MVPTLDTASRGRRPARTSVSMDDDNWTVLSDAESISSCSTASYDFSRIPGRQSCAPVFCVKKGEQDKPVYEAWNIHYFPRKRDTVEGFRVLGVKIENYEEFRGRTDVRAQPSTQSELAEMHLRGIEDFGTKQRRCWATRAFRGKGKTYEEDLEERCGKLPSEVKAAIAQLLFDRSSASSTRFRARTWTVVCMQEQLRHRFAQADFTAVKRHKFRFWKNPDPEEPLLYSVVIRGAETNAAACGDGISTFASFSNPWRHADNAEIRQKAREQREQRDALRRKRRASTAPYPSRSRSVSPPSYQSMSMRSRYGSPSPSGRNDGYESPPPYRRYTRSESPVRSRSPSVRIRVRPRYSYHFDEAPIPPTPPESFTPPPAVAAYNRPSVVSAPLPEIYGNPHLPRPPFAPNGASHPLYATPAPHGWFSPRPFNPLDTPSSTTAALPTGGNCAVCRASPACRHYPSFRPCMRPVTFGGNGIPYHPPCLLCAPGPMPRSFVPGPGGMGPMRAPPFRPPPPPRPAVFPRTPSPVGPMPPTPNPFSPLSTPALSSPGGSVSGGSTMSGPRTPVSGSVVGLPGAEVVEADASSSRSEAGGSDEL
ncbi:hypothetical protein C8A03DRAFT_32569 [Achaetomium macrosporum]|uniref:Uncharacterized protein n=1 Tax=Achaetomium macrosporum TaxID=79813 RepID=A0AAN7CCB4_9PEZI|nr:hypothetical protein C8A03DRAFT_32569 [Achaetomium macrosporum]